MRTFTIVIAACSTIVAVGCSKSSGAPDDQPLTTDPPGVLTLVADQGFDAPMDAVSSPDGKTFYFSAHTVGGDSMPGLFSVPSDGGSVVTLHAGEPLIDPAGLLMSCDGSTLYVADYGFDLDEAGDSPLYSLDIAGGALSAITVSGVGEAAGLAMKKDCETIYMSGYTPAGSPALFTVSSSGGVASILAEGAPMQSPSGVFVDQSDVAWVMDQLPNNGLGGGLWAIDIDGNINPVIMGLAISEPAGVSLVAGGETAVIPTRNDDDEGMLLAVRIETGEPTILEAPEMLEPAGIRTAREANIMAVVDTDGDAIYRAE